MPYTDQGKANMLSNLGVTHAAAFSGDPSGAGTELDRQAISFGAPAAGVMSESGTPQFSIGAGQTVDHIAFFDAASGGNLLAYGTVTAEAFANAGTYTLSTADLDLNA